MAGLRQAVFWPGFRKTLHFFNVHDFVKDLERFLKNTPDLRELL
jgi:hypothetical protein